MQAWGSERLENGGLDCGGPMVKSDRRERGVSGERPCGVAGGQA